MARLLLTCSDGAASGAERGAEERKKGAVWPEAEADRDKSPKQKTRKACAEDRGRRDPNGTGKPERGV